MSPVFADACAVGKQHAAAGRAERGFAALAACAEGDAEAERARERLRRQLEAGDDGLVLIDSAPTGASVTVSFLAADPPLRAPARLYLPPGRYHVTAALDGRPAVANEFVVGRRERVSVVLRFAPPAAAAPPKTTELDLGEDGPTAGAVMTTPDQRPRPHASLLPNRYQRGVDATDPDAPLAPLPEPPPEHRDRGPTPWVLSAAGAAALVAGAGLLIAGGDENTRRVAGIGCTALGAAGLGAGIYLFVRTP